jgi:oxygen-independent coproporphyrinogen III oxidase
MSAQEAVEFLRQGLETQRIPPFVCVYPPRSSYLPSETPSSVAALWEADTALSGSDLNLYVHIPFCSYKCGFCNLYTVICTEDELHARYVNSLARQLDLHGDAIACRRLRTIYVGGGTPTLLRPEHLSVIFDRLDRIQPAWRLYVEEVAIEASPDSLSGTTGARYARALGALGVDRVNIGVQSLEPRELREAGRARAGVDKIHQSIEAVRAARISNLSTDLIIGFHGQTDETWAASVKSLLEYRPDTISTYFLTIRPDAWFIRTKRYSYERDKALFARYDFARSTLLSAGYVQESNVRFILPGSGGYRQKTLQFAGVPVLGIGAGARSYNNTTDYLIGGGQNPSLRQIETYMEQAEAGLVTATSGFFLNDEERQRKRLVLDLFDLSLDELDRFGHAKHSSSYDPIFATAKDLGLISELHPRRMTLTPLGVRHRDLMSWAFFSDIVRARDENFYAELHRRNVEGNREALSLA